MKVIRMMVTLEVIDEMLETICKSARNNNDHNNDNKWSKGGNDNKDKNNIVNDCNATTTDYDDIKLKNEQWWW